MQAMRPGFAAMLLACCLAAAASFAQTPKSGPDAGGFDRTVLPQDDMYGYAREPEVQGARRAHQDLVMSCGRTSPTVSQQVHEIGIRMALGTPRADVLNLIARMTLKLATLGIVLGLLGSVAVMKVLASSCGASPRAIPRPSRAW
jgi:hypothetical protein